MSVRKIKDRWFIDFRFNGKRFRKNSPENSRIGARAYEAFSLQQLSRGINPFEKEIEKKIMTLKDFSLKWIELYARNNNKISGVKGKLSIFNTHLIPFMGNKKLNEITSFLIEEYKASALKKGLCNKTVNCHITVLNTCLTHAVEWNELETKPNIKRLKVVQQKFDFLTFEESEMLINVSRGIWKEMILFALHTGMRYGEIRAIRWQDINWEKKLITVKNAFYRDIFGATKSNKERYVPISPTLFELMEKKKRSRGFIFSDKAEKHLKENLPRQALRRIIEKTELKKANGRKIGWHAFRHTFASQLAMRGAPLSAIQQLLGHSNIQTTMRYAHLSPSTLNETIMLLESNRNNNFGQYMGNEQKMKEEFTRVLNSLNLQSTSKVKQKTEPCDSVHSSGDGES
jgi:integrase